MARDPTSPTTLQTDPQHWGLFLFKGKPYLYLANLLMVRDKPTDPQPRVKFKIGGANGVWGHGGTLTKYLLQVESPRAT